MNLLLFEPEELDGIHLKLSDRRAEHIIHVLGLKPGDTLKTGMVNGNTGTARVISQDRNELELEVHLSALPPDEPLVELILALPRPIMLRRILKQGTVLGVRRFHLIRTKRVHKSFFQTSLLEPEKLKEILLQGLEQTADTRLPEVLVHNRFMPFIERFVPALQPQCRILAHPQESAMLSELFAAGKINKSFCLAVGPEGGWSRYEIGQFTRQGFHCFSMGRRILHVDTAVVALLAQLRLLGNLYALDLCRPSMNRGGHG